MTGQDGPVRPATAGTDETYRYRTSEDERPSDGVFVALSAVADDALTPDRPLADTVDLDALDDLFARGAGSSPAGHVEFAHGEFRVRIAADGAVVAWRREAGDGG